MISKKAKKVLLTIAKQIVGKKREHLYVVDGDTGSVIGHSEGTTRRVKMDKKTSRELRSHRYKYVVIHNHPSGKAPSVRDVKNSLKRRPRESWVVASNGDIWIWKKRGTKKASRFQMHNVDSYRSVAVAEVNSMKTPPKRKKKAIVARTMELLAEGVKLEPLIEYKVIRANPSDPCVCCSSRTTHQGAMLRSNPYQPSKKDAEFFDSMREYLERRGLNARSNTRSVTCQGKTKQGEVFAYLSSEKNGYEVSYVIFGVGHREEKYQSLDDASSAFLAIIEHFWPMKKMRQKRLEAAIRKGERIPL